MDSPIALERTLRSTIEGDVDEDYADFLLDLTRFKDKADDCLEQSWMCHNPLSVVSTICC